MKEAKELRKRRKRRIFLVQSYMLETREFKFINQLIQCYYMYMQKNIKIIRNGKLKQLYKNENILRMYNNNIIINF